MTEQMIEQIARAIDPDAFSVRVSPFGGPFSQQFTERCEVARKQARAAHSVMAGEVAELTEALVAARVLVIDGSEPRTRNELLAAALATIDAALAHPKGME